MADVDKKHIKKLAKTTITALLFMSSALVLCAFTPQTRVRSAADAPKVKTPINSAAIVMEQSTGRVLYAENQDARLPIASTTKILTALTVIDNAADLDKKIKISKQAVGIEGSSIYLKEGEELSYRELLYGLMLRSGNDSAAALAIGVSGNLADFVTLMNETARKCGAVNCCFTNPHGLHDDKHLCSAYDLALITKEALNRPAFCEIVSAKSAKISGDPIRYLANKNKMLTNFDGANGVKTGFTKKSGRCLVTSAIRGGMQLISVVLNHGDMWNDSAEMLERAFSSFKMRKLIDRENLYGVDIQKGKYSKTVVKIPNDCYYPLTDGEFSDVRYEVDLPEYLTAPLQKGEIAGTMRVYLGNRLLFSDNFYTITNIQRKGFF